LSNPATNISLQVDKVALYQSTLTDAGSIYLALKEAELDQSGDHPV
jgi:2'-5' RNA ligase